MLVEFISGIDQLILSPSPNPTSSRLSTGVGSFSYFCVSFCFHILQWTLFPSSYVTLAWLKFNIMFSYNLGAVLWLKLVHVSLCMRVKSTCCWELMKPMGDVMVAGHLHSLVHVAVKSFCTMHDWCSNCVLSLLPSFFFLFVGFSFPYSW
jgi:hypothetical protein